MSGERKDPATNPLAEELGLVDRKDWPAGPWDREPDCVRWWHAGLPCVALRNTLGAWCGYVGLPEGHPWRKGSMAEVEADVHGGITYGPDPGDPWRYALPRDAVEEAAWRLGAPQPWEWVGFDLNHAGDRAPGMEAVERTYGWRKSGNIYRDLAYARREVEKLAAQVRAIADAVVKIPPRVQGG